jgi:hypothetical protein
MEVSMDTRHVCPTCNRALRRKRGAKLESAESVMARMTERIERFAPIGLTTFCRGFSINHRAAVKALVLSWAQRGMVRLTGRGTKSSPIVIERV